MSSTAQSISRMTTDPPPDKHAAVAVLRREYVRSVIIPAKAATSHSERITT